MKHWREQKARQKVPSDDGEVDAMGGDDNQKRTETSSRDCMNLRGEKVESRRPPWRGRF
jgi:hypothetical protein